MRFFSVLLLVACVSAGCFSATAPTAPATVVLAPGQSATYGGLVVQFTGVASDSRCPADALCIHQGDAVMTVAVRTVDSSATLALQVNDVATKRAVFAGYALQVDQLAPYPFGTVPIVSSEYRLTLTISRT